MTDLSARVEGLSGQCGETDALIHIAIGAAEGNTVATKVGWCVGARNNPSPVRAPSYTFSIDAAMRLLPDDPWIELKGPRKYLNIPTPVPNKWSATVSQWNHEGEATGWGATPALALCAAALKARGL